MTYILCTTVNTPSPLPPWTPRPRTWSSPDSATVVIIIIIIRSKITNIIKRIISVSRYSSNSRSTTTTQNNINTAITTNNKSSNNNVIIISDLPRHFCIVLAQRAISKCRLHRLQGITVGAFYHVDEFGKQTRRLWANALCRLRTHFLQFSLQTVDRRAGRVLFRVFEGQRFSLCHLAWNV